LNEAVVSRVTWAGVASGGELVGEALDAKPATSFGAEHALVP
jgi:hypothetical protein